MVENLENECKQIEKNDLLKVHLNIIINKYINNNKIEGAYLYFLSKNIIQVILIYNQVDLDLLKNIPNGINYKDYANESKNEYQIQITFDALNEQYLEYSGIIYNSIVLFDKSGRLTKCMNKSYKKKDKVIKVLEKSKRRNVKGM